MVNRFALTYNPAGQIISRTTSNDQFANTAHYDVDRGYTTNGLNQYTQAGPAIFTYDANGNLTGDGWITFTYDIENRLVAASGSKSLTLTYDPLGRLWETDPGTGTDPVTRFLYDGDALVAEYDYQNILQHRYVHGNGVDNPLLWYDGSTVSEATRRHLYANWQGSIAGITDGKGELIHINAYDAYGIPNPTNIGRFQYTGQIYLPELGIYHYKARAYSATLGRFLQTDPVGYGAGMNIYAYVDGDPVNFNDPSGLCPEETTSVTGSRLCKPFGSTTDGEAVRRAYGVRGHSGAIEALAGRSGNHAIAGLASASSTQGIYQCLKFCGLKGPTVVGDTIYAYASPVYGYSSFSSGIDIRIPGLQGIFERFNELRGVAPTTKRPDYCGSGSTESLVPESPAGIDVSDACRVHDKCWSTKTSRSKCDSAFRRNIKIKCLANGGGERTCNRIAAIYYRGVRIGGTLFYKGPGIDD